MRRLFLLTSAIALSTSVPMVQGQGVGGPLTGSIRGLSNDQRQWVGPLALVAKEDTERFRTFLSGYQHAAGTSYFHDFAPFLVGFDINISDPTTNPHIHSLTPIFSAQDGNASLGERIGTSTGKDERVIAKPGYAVTGVLLNHTGSYYAGIQLRFSRTLPDGSCDLNDSYASPAFGKNTGYLHEARGLPFCGIHVSPAGEKVLDGVAMLVSQKLVREKTPDLVPKIRSDAGMLPPAQATANAPAPAPKQTQPTMVVQRDNPVMTPQLSELIQTASPRLVLVKGSNGVGSGFAYKINGKAYCATNQHVIAGNQQIQFLSLSSGALKVGPAMAAVDHDLFIATAPEGMPAFDTVESVAKEVAIGDEVVVLGDPEGAGVVRPITGRILGIGPNLIEVSAQFVEGNSGSPIVHIKTGKVVGIASYASVKAFDAGAGQMAMQVRRFGFRLDTIQRWQQVDWSAYQVDAAASASAKEFTEALFNLFQSLQQGTFVASAPTDPRLQQAFSRLPKQVSSAQQQAQYVDAFIRELRNSTKFQSDDLRRRMRYDFFVRDVDGEIKLRELILKAIDESRDKVPVPASTRMPKSSSVARPTPVIPLPRNAPRNGRLIN